MDQIGFGKHISHQFTEELEEIITRVIAMGGLVEQQLQAALAVLVEGDASRVQAVIDGDGAINAMEIALDQDCVHVIARRQPAARDLRFIMAVIRTITDLERIGDEAERVARMGGRLAVAPPPDTLLGEIDDLGRQVRLMLRSAMDAFARMDAEHAVLTAKQDRLADRQYERILRGITEAMMSAPDSVPRMMELLWAARSLERIGDRARNICEHVIYCTEGKNMRHASLERMEQQIGDRAD